MVEPPREGTRAGSTGRFSAPVAPAYDRYVNYDESGQNGECRRRVHRREAAGDMSFPVGTSGGIDRGLSFQPGPEATIRCR